MRRSQVRRKRLELCGSYSSFVFADSFNPAPAGRGWSTAGLLLELAALLAEKLWVDLKILKGLVLGGVDTEL